MRQILPEVHCCSTFSVASRQSTMSPTLYGKSTMDKGVTAGDGGAEDMGEVEIDEEADVSGDMGGEEDEDEERAKSGFREVWDWVAPM